jgi:Uma2 family endonuclease
MVGFSGSRGYRVYSSEKKIKIAETSLAKSSSESPKHEEPIIPTDISISLENLLKEATTAAQCGKCFEWKNKWISPDIRMDQFDRIAESFPSIKMDYDNGKLGIIEFQGPGHQSVVSNFGSQLYHLFRSQNLKYYFRGGGGLSPTYDRSEDGSYSKRDHKADPDEALKVKLYGVSHFRLIFEIEIHNRNLSKLDERMKFLMNGWPECLIGIACKYFPCHSDKDPTFEGIALIYCKRDEIVQLEEIRDIGTAAWKPKRIDHLMKLNPEANVYNPSKECRCSLSTDPELSNQDVLTTSQPDFYSIQIDSDLLYRGTKYEQMKNRPTLTIDFLEITEALHSVKGIMFTGPIDLANVSQTNAETSEPEAKRQKKG